MYGNNIRKERYRSTLYIYHHDHLTSSMLNRGEIPYRKRELQFKNRTDLITLNKPQ